jgi:hypothetical protein
MKILVLIIIAFGYAKVSFAEEPTTGWDKAQQLVAHFEGKDPFKEGYGPIDDYIANTQAAREEDPDAWVNQAIEIYAGTRGQMSCLKAGAKSWRTRIDNKIKALEAKKDLKPQDAQILHNIRLDSKNCDFDVETVYDKHFPPRNDNDGTMYAVTEAYSVYEQCKGMDHVLSTLLEINSGCAKKSPDKSIFRRVYDSIIGR